MLRYIVKRVALMILMLPTALLTFFLLRVIPGDIVEVKLRADGATFRRR